MSLDLDAVAYRNRIDYRMRRLEETVFLLHTLVRPSRRNRLYDKHIDEIRQEIENASQDKQDITN